jgi:hypothetical protein
VPKKFGPWRREAGAWAGGMLCACGGGREWRLVLLVSVGALCSAEERGGEAKNGHGGMAAWTLYAGAQRSIKLKHCRGMPLADLTSLRMPVRRMWRAAAVLTANADGQATEQWTP